METLKNPFRVVVVDDSATACHWLRRLLEERYGEEVEVEAFVQAERALPRLGPDVDLLVLDWEMPGLDGTAVLEEALRRGVPCKRIVVRSAHPADELHRAFDTSGCLAVIEKGEARQEAAFRMILDGVARRPRATCAAGND